MPKPLPIIEAKDQLTAEQVATYAAEHDGCLHLIRSRSGELVMQVHPCDDGETSIAQSVPKATCEFVFRPPTGREIITYKKRQRTAAAETAQDDLFKSCVVYPSPEVCGPVYERFALIFSTPKLLRALMVLGGGEADESGKG